MYLNIAVHVDVACCCNAVVLPNDGEGIVDVCEALGEEARSNVFAGSLLERAASQVADGPGVTGPCCLAAFSSPWSEIVSASVNIFCSRSLAHGAVAIVLQAPQVMIVGGSVFQWMTRHEVNSSKCRQRYNAPYPHVGAARSEGIPAVAIMIKNSRRR